MKTFYVTRVLGSMTTHTGTPEKPLLRLYARMVSGQAGSVVYSDAHITWPKSRPVVVEETSWPGPVMYGLL